MKRDTAHKMFNGIGAVANVASVAFMHDFPIFISMKSVSCMSHMTSALMHLRQKNFDETQLSLRGVLIDLSSSALVADGHERGNVLSTFIQCMETIVTGASGVIQCRNVRNGLSFKNQW